ncbi:MAG: D-alanyl-D-alanine carboxypeptidase family protein, partial [Actinomycetota bacterium]
MPGQPNKQFPSLKDVVRPGLTAWSWQRWLIAFVVISLLVVVGDAGFAYAHRPWPKPYAVRTIAAFRQDGTPLAWPATGAAAIGAVGEGVLAITGTDTPRPMASTAKLITALTVLEAAPLSPGQAGPTLTVTAADAGYFGQYLVLNGSEVPLDPGEQINEYQALQALLIPSADDVADAMATWFYGSMPRYLAAANLLVQQLGMTETVVAGDASWFLASTVSTPADEVLLGQAALANPVIASISSQKSMTLPGGRKENSTDLLLGVDGITGIKTGNTDQAGGVFVFTAKHQVGSQTI